MRSQYTAAVLLTLAALMISCAENDSGVRRDFGRAKVTGSDSLAAANAETYNRLGRALRDSSRFYEAIDAHKKGLACAESACDTIQIIQALNNIGTDYRRLGILDEASSYHYKALGFCSGYSDHSSPTAVKNRVVTLNGIGNIQLTLGNMEAADSAFRQALAGEKGLGSALGQAINYANLGSIFEDAGQLDSARAYYTQSLEKNREAGSELGMSLCRTHFGRLYEKEHNIPAAIGEYREAYRIMESGSDTWHWLESCLALARVYIENGMPEMAAEYLEKAENTAQSISSNEHLAEVYRLKYLKFKAQGDSAAALDCYVRSRELDDEVTSEKNRSHMENLRINYERENSRREKVLMEEGWRAERERRSLMLQTALAVLILSLVAVFLLLWLLRVRNQKSKILQEAEATRTSFFTNITHEFRTPLTVIQAATADLNRRIPDDAQMRRDISDIERHGKSLLKLINQILDVAKLNSGRIDNSEMKKGDIVGFIQVICDSCRVWAVEKGVKLTYTPEEGSVEMVFMPDKLRKIVQNLLSNAVKFTPEGGAVQVISSVRDASLEIKVKDNGCGMSQGEKKNVFKPFYQASNAEGGTGIGLPLVKLAAEAMGGRVDLDTAPGVGSVFTVTIPLGSDAVVVRSSADVTESGCAADNLGAASGDDSGADTAGACSAPAGAFDADCPEDNPYLEKDTTRVLIVEDTAEVSRYMRLQLNPDYQYYFAADGLSGLQKAEEIVPDIIITDIMMPGIDGYELCRRVRSSELLNHIPVIMVTAKVTPEDRLEGLEAGADAYLEKPFRPDELNTRVEKLLEQRRLLREKFSSPEADNVRQTPSSAFIDKVRSEVLAMFGQGDVDYDVLAGQFCITRTQLNRKIKAVTGLTTTELILQLRIALAKELLDTTDCPVWEISAKCGMENDSYFMTLFKKATGMTPLQYRKREFIPN